MCPEVVVCVLDELNEGDEEAPGVRTVHDQPLQQNTGRTDKRTTKLI